MTHLRSKRLPDVEGRARPFRKQPGADLREHRTDPTTPLDPEEESRPVKRSPLRSSPLGTGAPRTGAPKTGIRGGRRVAVAVALGSVLALTATACGDNGSGSAGDKGTEGSGKGEITFWDNNGGVRTDIWKQIIADFEKKYPDIKVKYVGIPAASAQSKYDTAIQGGGLPDVGGVGTAMLAEVAVQGALEPLDSRIEKSALNGKLSQNLLDVSRAAGGGDTLYQVPTSANNGTLWYRTDLFKAAGLDAPTSWSKFYDAAAKLTDKGRNKFGFTIRGERAPSPRHWTRRTARAASPPSGTATRPRSTTRRTWRPSRSTSRCTRRSPRPPTSTTTSPRWSRSGTAAPSAC